MKYMVTYDIMETMRNSNEWLGATARAMASYPAVAMFPNPAMEMMRAWGEVTERSFARMVAKPDWHLDSYSAKDGRDHMVSVKTVVDKPFGNLIHFDIAGLAARKRKVLLVAPMSGHYATLLRKTVVSLLSDCEVYITDWHNARDIPVSAGKFDVEDYTLYLAEFMRELGPDTHVIAVCQPVPLALAATAYLAQQDPKAQPKSLTLIGGPVDPNANPTEVTDFGHSVTMGQLQETMIQRVGFKYPGVGRKVYPGLLQLASFISMNGETHATAFRNQIMAVAKGAASEHDKHNLFYDEYLAVMDMTAEFYLSTVERIFKDRDIALNRFEIAGTPVDIGAITDVAVHIIEGENDDISAPGQCLAALDLLTNLPDSKKAAHLEAGAGHYGIFAGASWRDNIRPLVLDFIDAHSGAPAAPVAASAPKAEAAPQAAPAPEVTTAPAAAPAADAATAPTQATPPVSPDKTAPRKAAKAKAAPKKKTAKKTATKKTAAKKAAPKKAKAAKSAAPAKNAVAAENQPIAKKKAANKNKAA